MCPGLRTAGRWARSGRCRPAADGGPALAAGEGEFRGPLAAARCGRPRAQKGPLRALRVPRPPTAAPVPGLEQLLLVRALALDGGHLQLLLVRALALDGGH